LSDLGTPKRLAKTLQTLPCLYSPSEAQSRRRFSEPALQQFRCSLRSTFELRQA
jgi:hypothetical protein